MDRREFIKILGLGSAGFLIGVPMCMPFRLQAPLQPDERVTLKVFGIGGVGCNIVDHVSINGIKGVDLAIANLDKVDLQEKVCPSKIYLGKRLMHQAGFDGGPELGQAYTMASRRIIKQYLKGSDVVLIVAGMGGITGTGGAPIVAQISRELGAWTVAIVTTPFRFEGKRRSTLAWKGIEKLKVNTDAIILVPSDSVLQLIPHSATVWTAFRKLNEILLYVVKALIDFLVCLPSSCVDFNDIKNSYSTMGMARVGIGLPRQGGLKDAVLGTIRSPLLDGLSLGKARTIICSVYISGKESLSEVQGAMEILRKEINEDADFLWKALIRPVEVPKVVVFAGRFA